MNNQYDFTNTGGFPVDQTLFSDFQNGIADAQSVSRIMGDLVIMSGCVDDGAGNVGNGVVSANGEILPFVGGAEKPTVFVKSVEVGGVFQDGQTKPVKNVRTVQFGTGSEQYTWADFRRSSGLLERIEKLEKMCAPIAVGTGGTMMFWNKPANTIPAGWQEVVDWRGRMPIGYDPTDADFNNVGNVGGNKTVSIQKTNLPNVKIDIEVPVNSTSDITDGYGGMCVGSGGSDGNGFTRQMNTKELGDGAALNVLNPYRTVLFIEFVG